MLKDRKRHQWDRERLLTAITFICSGLITEAIAANMGYKSPASITQPLFEVGLPIGDVRKHSRAGMTPEEILSLSAQFSKVSPPPRGDFTNSAFIFYGDCRDAR